MAWGMRHAVGAEGQAACTWYDHLVHGRVRSTARHSWKASVPTAAVGTWPESATMGVESPRASWSGVMMFVSPGPDVVSTTPTLPDARA